MSMEQLLATIRSFDGVLDLAPTAGGEAPEIAWGDHFFYYAPDGQVPAREQPYATLVTKDYPGDTLSRLDPPGRWRVNVRVGARLAGLVDGEPDPAAADAFLPHPVYGGWIAVVNPGARTTGVLVALLRDAHEAARRRAGRRGVG